MKHSTGFILNGIESSTMGVIQASVEDGLFEDNFLPTRKINEQKIRGNEKSYLFGHEYEPFSFSLTLTFEHGFTDEQAREVARWLSTPHYVPLQFHELPRRIIYCMYEGDSKLIHNGCQQGYLQVQMRCDAPWYYSNVIESQTYDFSENTSEGSNLTFENKGDLPVLPMITIEKIGNGDIKIVNTSNGGKEFKFTGLVDGEILEINNEYDEIESSLKLDRYSAHNDVFLELGGYSNSYLKVYGKCRIKFNYQMRFLF
ncbi:phage tail family protein [Fictibacillus nanhaiensis]|uniref:phage tail domain-containing protein n=1 Tax=Fictibacillus nanhaiensis TaxID=742169 RepID=UPI002E1D4774|nr:phage tail family protein [Fictibacillus nanhaiensis]